MGYSAAAVTVEALKRAGKDFRALEAAAKVKEASAAIARLVRS